MDGGPKSAVCSGLGRSNERKTSLDEAKEQRIAVSHAVAGLDSRNDAKGQVGQNHDPERQSSDEDEGELGADDVCREHRQLKFQRVAWLTVSDLLIKNLGTGLVLHLKSLDLNKP